MPPRCRSMSGPAQSAGAARGERLYALPVALALREGTREGFLRALQAPVAVPLAARPTPGVPARRRAAPGDASRHGALDYKYEDTAEAGEEGGDANPTFHEIFIKIMKLIEKS